MRTNFASRLITGESLDFIEDSALFWFIIVGADFTTLPPGITEKPPLASEKYPPG